MAAPRNKKTPAPTAKAAQVKESPMMMANRYRAQEKVKVSISPMYQPYFGKRMPIVLNGIPVYVPVDGKHYAIPKSYAIEVAARIRNVDDQRARLQRMADVKKNAETYAGERDLIQPAK